MCKRTKTFTIFFDAVETVLRINISKPNLLVTLQFIPFSVCSSQGLNTEEAISKMAKITKTIRAAETLENG